MYTTRITTQQNTRMLYVCSAHVYISIPAPTPTSPTCTCTCTCREAQAQHGTNMCAATSMSVCQHLTYPTYICGMFRRTCFCLYKIKCNLFRQSAFENLRAMAPLRCCDARGKSTTQPHVHVKHTLWFVMPHLRTDPYNRRH